MVHCKSVQNVAPSLVFLFFEVRLFEVRLFSYIQPGKNRSSSHATEHRKSSLRGPLPSRYKRHSVSSIGHASLSPLSRQSSWNEYKGHSPPIYRRGAGWGPDFNRNPSCPEPRTIFDGSLDEVAKLLHKMAEAIERDMDQN